MAKKKSRKLKSSKSKNVDVGFEIRRPGVVVEDIRDSIQLLAESVSGIQSQLIAIRDMVAKNTADIEVIKMNMELIKYSLKQKADNADLSALERRVSILEKHR